MIALPILKILNHFRAAFRILLKGGSKIAVSAYQGGKRYMLYITIYIKMKCSRGVQNPQGGGGGGRMPPPPKKTLHFFLLDLPITIRTKQRKDFFIL